jgi:hypothetical protein
MMRSVTGERALSDCSGSSDPTAALKALSFVVCIPRYGRILEVRVKSAPFPGWHLSPPPTKAQPGRSLERAGTVAQHTSSLPNDRPGPLPFRALKKEAPGYMNARGRARPIPVQNFVPALGFCAPSLTPKIYAHPQHVGKGLVGPDRGYRVVRSQPRTSGSLLFMPGSFASVSFPIC